MKPEPIFAGVEALRAAHGPGRVSSFPPGILLTPETAARLSKEEHLILLCGRYEGVDQRVADHLADEELSIGDYVLSGGELPALVLIDAVAGSCRGSGGPGGAAQRLVLAGDPGGAHYTRPRDFRGWTVPTFSCRGTTPPSPRGARRKGSAGRRGTARTC